MPTFENLSTNQLSSAGLDWFAELLRVIETLGPATFVALMSEDVEVSPDGGASWQHGRGEVGSALAEAWARAAVSPTTS